MKIAVLTVGTRGEVDPCIALGGALQAAGHDVRIATHAAFRPLVRDAGLDFSLIDIDIGAFLQSESSPTAGDAGPVKALRGAIQSIKPMIRQAGGDCWAASQGAEAVLYTIGGFFFAPHIAEKLRIPAIGIYPYPTGLPTRAFPNIFSPVQGNLGGGLNQSTHLLFEVMSWLPLRSSINAWRGEVLDLPPLGRGFPKWYRREQMRMLYGFSPHVVPRPPDWGERVDITGYWLPEPARDWQPPADLVEFIEAGPPPVYVGFGSMNLHDPERVTGIVLEALAQAGQRGLLLAGEGRLVPDHERARAVGADVHFFTGAPFDRLFPQMAAVVHHGGSGTTALGMRAGVPTVVVHFMMDQPFWGRRVVDLGVGAGPIPFSRLSVDRLATAIQTAATNGTIQERAAILGERIRAEDGVAKAVELINRYLRSGTGK
jgi:sterol 3beta-glucosyltransferase